MTQKGTSTSARTYEDIEGLNSSIMITLEGMCTSGFLVSSDNFYVSAPVVLGNFVIKPVYY